MSRPWPLLLQAFATFAMTGLIWFVQVVHYPLFRSVGAPGYAAYQAEHMRLATLVVGPLMLLEAATALWLVLDRPAFVSPAQAWAGLALRPCATASTPPPTPPSWPPTGSAPRRGRPAPCCCFSPCAPRSADGSRPVRGPPLVV